MNRRTKAKVPFKRIIRLAAKQKKELKKSQKEEIPAAEVEAEVNTPAVEAKTAPVEEVKTSVAPATSGDSGDKPKKEIKYIWDAANQAMDKSLEGKKVVKLSLGKEITDYQIHYQPHFRR